MFCPQCGSTQNDELKFCKQCGSNLHALRKIMSSRDESEAKFDWNRTWVKEMFMSSEESVRHKAELERLQGITPESKRLAEVKAGVITASVGIGLMIVLFVIMNGIILSGGVSGAAVEILSRIWIAGVIPVLVGLALIFNGTVVSRRSAQLPKGQPDQELKSLNSETAEAYLSPAETNQLNTGSPYSIVDETTRNLVKEKR
jgi:hypothetical protein